MPQSVDGVFCWYLANYSAWLYYPFRLDLPASRFAARDSNQSVAEIARCSVYMVTDLRTNLPQIPRHPLPQQHHKLRLHELVVVRNIQTHHLLAR